MALEITWYGQSMFRIADAERSVVCDPTSPDTGYIYDPVDADIVLITHEHFDHNYREGVSGNPRFVAATGDHRVGGLEVVGMPSFHDARGGRERGPNIIYSWEQSGMRIAHLGDLGEKPEKRIMDDLKNHDLLMIPVGGVFTIDGKEAAGLLSELSPRIAIPMHYKTEDCRIQLKAADDLLSHFSGPVKEPVERPLSLEREELPEGPEVWILPYK